MPPLLSLLRRDSDGDGLLGLYASRGGVYAHCQVSYKRLSV
jgi:hypothetical protein